MKAVVSEKKGGPVIVVERSRPRLRPTYMLVRPVAVALNPADVLYNDLGLGGDNALLGCDYAGVVEEVGAEVQRTFEKGDRVCGPTRAADPYEIENGAFAELICVKADMALHIPDDVEFAEASTMGVTNITTGRCLYQKLDLPWPNQVQSSAGPLFVYGGSSAMGTMVIQFAKLSNFEVITTCSAKNFDLCTSFGADHVLDYSDPQAPDQIKQLTKNSLKLCVDCISTDEAATFCAQVLQTGGKYSAILTGTFPRDDIESFRTLGYSFLGEEWELFGAVNPPSMEDFEYSKNFAELSERLWKNGKIKCHPVDVRQGGFDALPQAIDDLRAKKVSGRKIVVKCESGSI